MNGPLDERNVTGVAMMLSCGCNFTNSLTDALWTIDGHSHVFSSISFNFLDYQPTRKFRSLKSGMAQCKECLVWPFIYSKHKLSKGALKVAMDDITVVLRF